MHPDLGLTSGGSVGGCTCQQEMAIPRTTRVSLGTSEGGGSCEGTCMQGQQYLTLDRLLLLGSPSPSNSFVPGPHRYLVHGRSHHGTVGESSWPPHAATHLRTQRTRDNAVLCESWLRLTVSSSKGSQPSPAEQALGGQLIRPPPAHDRPDQTEERICTGSRQIHRSIRSQECRGVSLVTPPASANPGSPRRRTDPALPLHHE